MQKLALHICAVFPVLSVPLQNICTDEPIPNDWCSWGLRPRLQIQSEQRQAAKPWHHPIKLPIPCCRIKPDAMSLGNIAAYWFRSTGPVGRAAAGATEPAAPGGVESCGA